jgi:hypothetical protein
LGDLGRCSAKSTFALLIRLDRKIELGLIKFGPIAISEIKLGVGKLPE